MRSGLMPGSISLELAPHSILIMDNAAFHKTGPENFDQAGLNLNPIEQDFATIKKRRRYAPPETPLDDIIRTLELNWSDYRYFHVD